MNILENPAEKTEKSRATQNLIDALKAYHKAADNAECSSVEMLIDIEDAFEAAELPLKLSLR